jgi:heme exporter protein D
MSDFLSQGGYAAYVWGAYGMVAALLVAETIGLRRQRREIAKRLGRMQRLRASGGER